MVRRKFAAFWNLSGRSILISALPKYPSDFETPLTARSVPTARASLSPLPIVLSSSASSFDEKTPWVRLSKNPARHGEASIRTAIAAMRIRFMLPSFIPKLINDCLTLILPCRPCQARLPPHDIIYKVDFHSGFFQNPLYAQRNNRTMRQLRPANQIGRAHV